MDRASAPPPKGLSICVTLVAITLAVFGQTWHHDFISLDDADYVYDNPVVSQGLTFHGLVWAFTRFYSGNWHPLTWLSHMLDCQWYGLHPGGHHLTNVLIHAATAMALFLVLRRMTGALWRSAFVAAVFAVHPLRVESVAWVAERKDVLSGFFFMLTLWAYAQYASRAAAAEIGKDEIQATKPEAAPEPPHTARSSLILTRQSSLFPPYLLALVFFACGLMSKPMLVTTPFVLLLLDFWPLGRFSIRAPENEGERENTSSTSRLIILFLEKAPFFAMSLACGIVTLLAQREAIHAGETYPFSYRLGNALVSSIVYLGQFVWPAHLAVYYPFPRHGPPIWELALAVLLMAGFSAVAWKQRYTRPWLLVGWLWYVIMLLPVVGILQAGMQAHADRYTYLPLIGICIAITWLATQWPLEPAISGGLAAGAVAVLMVCAWRQTGYWQNGKTLWDHALAVTQDNDLAHYCLGHDLFASGKLDPAISQLRQAVKIRPEYPDALNGLGVCYYQQGKISDAMSEFEQALKAQPRSAAAHNGLGLCLCRQGRPAESIAQYQAALKLQPDYPEALNNLGNSLFQLGRAPEAGAQYQKAAQLQPGFAEAHNNLGLCRYHQGRLDEAAAEYRIALKLKPRYLEALDNLGNVFFGLGRMEDALAQYRKALEIDPHSAGPHVNIGAALFQMGRLDAAISEFQKAVEIQPNLAAAHDSLGMAFLKKGNEGEALREFQTVLRLTPNDSQAQVKLGWLLATCTRASLRDGRKAMELAQQANAASGGKDAVALETLAAALAELGRFDEAKATVQKAIVLAQAGGQTELVAELNRELRRYEARQALHP